MGNSIPQSSPPETAAQIHFPLGRGKPRLPPQPLLWAEKCGARRPGAVDYPMAWDTFRRIGKRLAHHPGQQRIAGEAGTVLVPPLPGNPPDAAYTCMKNSCWIAMPLAHILTQQLIYQLAVRFPFTRASVFS